MPFPFRVALRVGVILLAGLLIYEMVTFGQVLMASRRDEARPAEAIVVFGAAQYDGRPSPVLKSRLDHAFKLYEEGLADIIVVTGGRKEGDRFTEAAASANYLISRGVPDSALRREVQGTTSWESLAAAARILREEGLDDVLLVSDPYHSYRIASIADELGLTADVSPADVRYSTATEIKNLVRESAAVSVGKVIGFRRLMRVDDAIDRR